MGRFLAWNTDDPNATAAGYTLPTGSGGATPAITIGPLETDISSKVAGSVFCDQAGTLQIQQSFDYWLSGNVVNTSPHFDCIDTIAVSASTGTKIDVDVIAPVLRIVFTVTGASDPTHLRIFCRTYGAKG